LANDYRSSTNAHFFLFKLFAVETKGRLNFSPNFNFNLVSLQMLLIIGRVVFIV